MAIDTQQPMRELRCIAGCELSLLLQQLLDES